jgi:hypothetical protein
VAAVCGKGLLVALAQVVESLVQAAADLEAMEPRIVLELPVQQEQLTEEEAAAEDLRRRP